MSTLADRVESHIMGLRFFRSLFWLVARYHDHVVALDGLHASVAQASAITRGRSESENKALVLEAFDTLFNKRDYDSAERYWSPNYIQHSAHIAPGREGLFNLIKSIPATLKYEPGMIVAEGDLVMFHGRFSGFGQPTAWVVADILRIADGVLTEHWDVIQDEATQQQSKSGHPMFGDRFPM